MSFLTYICIKWDFNFSEDSTAELNYKEWQIQNNKFFIEKEREEERGTENGSKW